MSPPASPPAIPCQNGLLEKPVDGGGEPGTCLEPGVPNPGLEGDGPGEGLEGGALGAEKLRLPRLPEDDPPPARAQALDSSSVATQNMTMIENNTAKYKAFFFISGFLLLECCKRLSQQ